MRGSATTLCLLCLLSTVTPADVHHKKQHHHRHRHFNSAAGHPHLWSHGCAQPLGPAGDIQENTIQGCATSLKNGYTGIEVDAIWHGGKFYMAHDAWDSTAETLDKLLAQMQDAGHHGYGMWVDLKNKEGGDAVLRDLHHLLVKHDMLATSIVELNNYHWRPPDGMRFMYCYNYWKATRETSMNCRKGAEVNAALLGPGQKPLYTWGMSRCKARAGDVLLLTQPRPQTFSDCEGTAQPHHE
jgi:hypothetical protein